MIGSLRCRFGETLLRIGELPTAGASRRSRGIMWLVVLMRILDGLI